MARAASSKESLKGGDAKRGDAKRKLSVAATAGPRGSRRFFQRANATTSLILTLPVFIAYEVGLLVSDRANGVDFITAWIIKLLHLTRERYLLLNVGLAVALGIAILILQRKNRFDLGVFGPVILESAVYAVTMSSAILLVMRHVLHVDKWQMAVAGAVKLSLLDKVVVSLGAGFHEELVFRLILLGGIATITIQALKWRPLIGYLCAFLISATLFSLAHHTGPAGEPFTIMAFVFRVLAGLIFGLLFYLRGFATAVYTHTLYDMFVLFLR